MNFDYLTVILIISITLQIGAVIIALKLIKVTGTSKGWILISISLILMAFRRSSSLMTMYIPGFNEYYRGMVAESTALIISISMLFGIYFLSEVFTSKKDMDIKIAQSKESLRESHEVLETIMDGLDAIVYVADMKTYEILFVNKYAQDRFGNIVGKTCWKTIQTNQSGPCDFCTNDKLINAEGKPTDIYEWEHYNNNVERWYSIRDRAIPWHDGRIVRLEIAMDITENKNKNNELERLRLLNTIEASLNEIYMFDAETYRFVYVNHGPLQNIGYTEEEMKSMTPLDVHPELDESTFNDLIAPLVQNEKDIIEFTTVHKRADGSMYPVEVHLQLVRNDEAPIFLAVILDITKRKQAEENLIHSHYLMQYIISHAQNAIAVHDRDLKYLYVSEQYLKQYNIKEKDIIGKHHYDVFPDLPQKWKDVHQKALAGEVSSKDEDPYEREDGSVDWTRWECRPWYEADGSIGGIIVYTEVITECVREKKELLKYRDHLEELVKERTDEIKNNQQALVNIVEDLNLTTEELQSANERLKELDRMKSMFIASTSHELRTPLNSIIGFTSVLLEGWSGELNPEQKEQLGIVLTSGKYLLSLINDVIDISKIEAGKLEVYIEQFSFLDMVKEASSLVKPDIERKGLTLTVDVPDIMIDTDRRRLLQCIINLLSNAIKFTEKGGITIKAKTINNVIDISISDTGIGIKSEDLRKLFKAFVRLESPLTDKTSGTGLGLYLTDKLVHEVLGGMIDATSKHGEGSTFTLHIPITQGVQK